MRLRDRLDAARRSYFVGREAELNFFRETLEAAVFPFFVLYVYGPGGIGKSTLLGEYARLVEQKGWKVLRLDARNIEPTPESFLNALSALLHLSSDENWSDTAARFPRMVLFLDTYETLTPLDDWLRETLLPQAPENVLIVLAGRNPPAVAWRADPGWQTILTTMPLRNLSPDESRSYLSRRRVPDEQQKDVLRFTHGHPLALSLVAETFAQRAGDIKFQFEEPRDIIHTLVKNFLQKVPGPAHRAALEACSLVRVTTEPVLCEMLANPDVHDLFAWLAELSFIESRPGGLFPHDLAREALAADLRWRNPDWYVELHRRARHYYTHRISLTSGVEQQRALFDLVYLHRDNPVMRPYFEWQMGGSALPDRLQNTDVPLLLGMVARHEGAESARLAAFWLEHHPERVLIPRAPDGAPAGFLLTLDLAALSPEDRAADPATRAAWHALQQTPLRPGETALLFRFWMDAEAYQAVSSSQSLIFIHIARHYLTQPGLAMSFFPCADPDFWEPLCAYINLARLPQADFSVGGRRYAVFGHDWRIEPPAVWLAVLADREIANAPEPALPPGSARPVGLVVLSEPDFAAAVREALRHFRQPKALSANPLLRSRLVQQQAPGGKSEQARIEELQRLIEKAAGRLQATPKETKYFRALYHTYLQPAATQEQAAELLDLPFSTYRRHLRRGLERVTATLWEWEIGGEVTA